MCYPSWYESELENAEWKTVYRKWCIWQQFGKWPFIVRSDTENTLSKVTCVKVSGKCTVTGHENGCLYMWYNDFIEEPLTRHNRDVTDLGLIVGRRIMDTRQEEMKHTYVVSTSKDCAIRISKMFYRSADNHYSYMVFTEHNAATLSVSVSADTFAVLSEDATISVWQLKFHLDSVVPNVVMCYKIRLFANHVSAISVYGTKIIQVTAVTHKGVLIPVYSRDGVKSYNLLPEDICNFLTLKEWENICGRIVAVYLWRFGISIILTDEHYMYVSLMGQKLAKYNTMSYLHSYPVTVLLYGDFLILGMESGSLYMYYTKEVSQLLSLDLEAYTWKCNTLCSKPIIGLDITESGDAPKIAATTGDKMFFITFIPPWLQ